MRAAHDDFCAPAFCGVFLVVVLSVVYGYHFGRGEGVLLSFVDSLVSGFLLVFALVFVLRLVFFLRGKSAGIRVLFNLVVFSLFLPVSLALWLESKGIDGLDGLLLSYSFVCIAVSCVRLFREAD